MSAIVALSEVAVAILRFLIKGYRRPVSDRTLTGFRELTSAGILEPSAGSELEFQFTEDGWTRRHEILAAAERELLDRLPHLPDRIDLSESARTALRRYISGDDEVTEGNRHAYRELARAGIMMSVGTFTTGDDCVFRFTYRGWERRFEFAEMTCPKATA